MTLKRYETMSPVEQIEFAASLQTSEGLNSETAYAYTDALMREDGAGMTFTVEELLAIYTEYTNEALPYAEDFASRQTLDASRMFFEVIMIQAIQRKNEAQNLA